MQDSQPEPPQLGSFGRAGGDSTSAWTINNQLSIELLISGNDNEIIEICIISLNHFNLSTPISYCQPLNPVTLKVLFLPKSSF
jgi:hypothetical protein